MGYDVLSTPGTPVEAGMVCSGDVRAGGSHGMRSLTWRMYWPFLSRSRRWSLRWAQCLRMCRDRSGSSIALGRLLDRILDARTAALVVRVALDAIKPLTNEGEFCCHLV